MRAFWQAIDKITVLDPTCGSGAFLFAALSILEPLYEACLERMERFVEDHATRPHHPDQFADFKKVLTQIDSHPNRAVLHSEIDHRRQPLRRRHHGGGGRDL